MKQVKASEFKAQCLKLLERVAKTGDTVIITKRGRPVAQLGPVRRPARSLLGAHKGQMQIFEDLVKPLDESWEADM